MIERAAELIDRARTIVTFSGAGLSAESGVGTFRDASGEGLWSNFDPMRLASPEGFANDPETVVEWYNWRRRQIAEAAPNPAHEALARRADIANVTQNVDDLLERAGANDDAVIHLHGRIGVDQCNRAGCAYRETIDMANPPGLRACPDCRDRLRPGVVWFGEALPTDEWSRAEQACTSCDLLLVVGTSAVVYPAAGLVSVAKSTGATIVVVNTEPSGASHLADVEITGTAGDVIPRLLAPE